jgi:hypothetical protein
MPRDLRIINNTIYAGVFTTLPKNAMSGKVLASKVLGFKSIHVTPSHFLGNSPACTLKNTIYLIFCIGLFYS